MDENSDKIKELESEIQRLKQLVYHDELTRIYNRRGFLDKAERAFKAISFGNSELEKRIGFPIPYSLIFIDVDNFKSVNDTYGHEAGDIVLQEVAQVLDKHLRASDYYGRWGGEEFIVALLGADSKAATGVAEKLRAAVEKLEIMVEGEHLHITASFGVMEYAGQKSFDEMVKLADEAMYKAKQEGKNRVVAL